MRTVLVLLVVAAFFIGAARAQNVTTAPVLMEVDVRITDGGECVVGKIAGSCQTLGTRLKAMYAYTGTEIALDVDVMAKVEVVLAALNSLKGSGLTQYHFVARTHRDTHTQ